MTLGKPFSAKNTPLAKAAKKFKHFPPPGESKVKHRLGSRKDSPLGKIERSLKRKRVGA